MAEISYPAANGQGVIEHTYEKLMAQVMGSGRIEVLGRGLTAAAANLPAVYADSSGRQVKIRPNIGAIVRGFKWETDGEGLVVPLAANASGAPLIDLVVLRLDRSEWTVRIHVIRGMPAATPVPPAARQTFTSTDVWDLPLAQVRVASSGVAGMPTIAGDDVTPVETLTGPPPVMGRAVQRGQLPMGQKYLELDTSRVYMGTPRGAALIGENGPWTKVAPIAGWKNDEIYCQRINGLVYFQCQVQLSAASRSPNSDTTVCDLPRAFWPLVDVPLLAFLWPGQVGRVIVRATGRVSLVDFGTTFPQDGYLTTQPTPWPAREVLR